jgi:hypothetical protein
MIGKLAPLKQGQESIANENVAMFLLKALEDITQVFLSPRPHFSPFSAPLSLFSACIHLLAYILIQGMCCCM